MAIQMEILVHRVRIVFPYNKWVLYCYLKNVLRRIIFRESRCIEEMGKQTPVVN